MPVNGDGDASDAKDEKGGLGERRGNGYDPGLDCVLIGSEEDMNLCEDELE
jgi:hypothetical protein